MVFARRFGALGMTVLVAAALIFFCVPSRGEDKKPTYSRPDTEKVEIIPKAWKQGRSRSVTSAEIDELLSKAHQGDQVQPAPKTTDEQFLRRVTLDLTGKLPTPTEISQFVNDSDPQKRSKVIDRLLDSDAFATHWARYWSDVIVSRATNDLVKRTGISRSLELWFAQQLRENRTWSEIARSLITANGEVKFGPPNADASQGPAVFLLCHQGAEAAVERAAETSRVFLGIQIQCAQCHDHPSDIWKREQFHELTAFYARVGDRLVRNSETNRFEGIALVSRPFGEHLMPNLENPRQRGTLTHPKFLTGESYLRGRSDQDRREALAQWITSKDNYWFSAAFVNRVWAELLGQGFYQPVDAMGPLQAATYPDVLYRLADSFRASDYDIRQLYRVILNTEAYQRQIRLGDSPDEHLRFAAAYPSRLNAHALWNSLECALGPIGAPPFPNAPRPGGARFLPRNFLEFQFKDLFGFDPSTKSDEVEGSVPQALMLMNNLALNNQIRAVGDTTLARILRSTRDDREAIEAVYLRVLARKPTASELQTCREYIAQVGNRGEAFEDILWALINSTEFQSRR
ncbi:MAG: DUF1549 and DUF1553 domain-containing protein [Gemmatales bacterium]|nr:DUF1549 and DUF1553 domain-containing protein [Gemmatales bacterium]MDW8388086.1 DUF1549 domain-containing protein [Gemmatales bacterium]